MEAWQHQPYIKAEPRLQPYYLSVFGAALLLIAGAVVVGDGLARMILLLTGMVLAGASILFWLLARRDDDRSKNAVDDVAAVVAHDPTPSFLTGRDRALLYANDAANQAFRAREETTLTDALGTALAGAAALLADLEQEVRAQGAACREVPVNEGVYGVTAHIAKAGHILWRVEWRANLAPPPPLELPVAALQIDAQGDVIETNAAARDLLGPHAEAVALFAPGSQLKTGNTNDIHTPKGIVPCLTLEAAREEGKRELYLFPTPQELAGDTGWTFFDSLPVPLLKLSADGLVLLSNRPARKLLGGRELEGARLSDLMEGPGRPVQEWLADIVAGRIPARSEVLRLWNSGTEEVHAQTTLTPTSDNGHTVVIAVLNDATPLKSLERQVTQSQKMQAIGQLAGGVAHDFNNLLTAISGHCDLLLLRHEPSDEDYPDLIQISQNANRAAALVGQLLAYSRKQTMRPEIMDLREMLSDLTHLLNRLVGERVTLSVTNMVDLWAVRADKRQLEQVIMNLVVNARDAMADGGDIRIKTENLVLTEPLERDRAEVPPGRYVKVSVTDQGIGINEESRVKVFEPFYTTKKLGEGTGLGLSTVYGIVKQTGGFIFVDSQEGEGADFMLLLPAHDHVVRQADPKTPTERREIRAEGVVLLVEDEAPVRAFASRALKMRGVSVLEAGSAEEALDLLKDSTLHVDVFVTDVIMPGMDGPSWVREALKTRPDTRVVFVSGYAPETFGETNREIPNAAFLPKPFSLTELTDTVQTQLAN